MITVEQQIQEFNNEYSDEIQEIIILTPSTTVGAAKSQNDVLWTASQCFMGYIDLNNDQLIKANGRVEWLAEDSENQSCDYGYHFNSITQYRLKVRRAKPANPKSHAYSSNENFLRLDLTHCFMLLEVMEKSIHEPRLDQMRTAFLHPVFIDNQLGKFQLDKDSNIYKGEIDWLGEQIGVKVEDNGDTTNVERCFIHLMTMVKNAQDLDNKMRHFAAETLLENAQEWQDEENEKADPLTIEDFINRISLTELVMIDDEGNFSAYFNNGDLFWDHAIIVTGNIDGTLENAYMAG